MVCSETDKLGQVMRFFFHLKTKIMYSTKYSAAKSQLGCVTRWPAETVDKGGILTDGLVITSGN